MTLTVQDLYKLKGQSAAHNAKLRETLTEDQKELVDLVSKSMDDIMDAFATNHHKKFDEWCEDNMINKVEFASSMIDLPIGQMRLAAGKIFIKRPDNKIQEITEYINVLEKNLVLSLDTHAKLKSRTNGFWNTIKFAFAKLKRTATDDQNQKVSNGRY